MNSSFKISYPNGCGIFFCLLLSIVFGHFSGGGTPVLIPNTEVKSSSAYGTLGFTYGRVGRGQEQ